MVGRMCVIGGSSHRAQDVLSFVGEEDGLFEVLRLVLVYMEPDVPPESLGEHLETDELLTFALVAQGADVPCILGN